MLVVSNSSVLRPSLSLYSIDDDFVFINSRKAGLQDYNRNSVQIKPDLSFRSDQTTCFRSVQSRGRIDPIYEIIAEQSETDDMYCLPIGK